METDIHLDPNSHLACKLPNTGRSIMFLFRRTVAAAAACRTGKLAVWDAKRRYNFLRVVNVCIGYDGAPVLDLCTWHLCVRPTAVNMTDTSHRAT